MFESARLKLTAWYLLIIMLISIVFSVAFYRLATVEFERVIRREELRREYPGNTFFDINPIPLQPSAQDLADSEERLKIILIIINGGIFIVAGAAGYFLAGRTLKPIKEMVDEQNRFITDSSHELRTPLTALRSEMEAALLDDHLSEEEAKQLIGSNLEEVIHLQTLSDDLLELAHFQAQKSSQKFEELSLLQIAEDALKRVTPLAKKKHITIANEIDDVSMRGIKNNLVELFVILLDNAVKYSDSKTTITFKSEKVDHSVRVSVSDQGMGIDEKDVPHIFDRFYRADKSRTKTTVDGYGLGLSIAKKIVEMHDGEMKVKSKVGKGTTFTVELPTS